MPASLAMTGSISSESVSHLAFMSAVTLRNLAHVGCSAAKEAGTW
jgi:hypothetical protein